MAATYREALLLGLAFLLTLAFVARAVAQEVGDGVEFVACSDRGKQGVVRAIVPGSLATLYRVDVLAPGQPARSRLVTSSCFRVVAAPPTAPVPPTRPDVLSQVRALVCTQE